MGSSSSVKLAKQNVVKELFSQTDKIANAKKVKGKDSSPKIISSPSPVKRKSKFASKTGSYKKKMCSQMTKEEIDQEKQNDKERMDRFRKTKLVNMTEDEKAKEKQIHKERMDKF